MSKIKNIRDIARELRKNQTPYEAILWEHLRNRKLEGVKFLRQHPIAYQRFDFSRAFFIADFYCAQLGLVVELDGPIHDFQKDYDKNRNKILEQLNLKVIRFKNEDLKDIEKVLNKIKSLI